MEKKIVVLTNYLFETFGGTQTFNRAFVKALDDLSKENDFSFVVLSMNDKGDSNLISKYISNEKNKYKSFNGSKFLFSIAAIKEMLTADIAFYTHVHLIVLANIVGLLNKKIKQNVVVHGIDVWRKLPSYLLSGLKHVEKILSVSSFTKDEMIKFNGVDESKFLIFPNTLDPFYGLETGTIYSKNELGLPEGKMILTVSRLAKTEKKKNIDLLIKSIKKIRSKVPDSYLVVVGDGDGKDSLVKLASEEDALEYVYFPGKVPSEKIASYYKNCDLFTLLSEKEGFGIVYLEAMYYGKPCVGLSAGGVPDVFYAPEVGCLIDGKEERVVQNKLIEMMSRISDYNHVKEKMEKRFSFEEFKKRLFSLI